MTAAAAGKEHQILQAGLHLFAERGFDATAVPAIAKEAGVGAGTIYRYFENKETLGNVLFQQCLSRFKQTLKNGYPADSENPREQFQHFFYGMVTFTNENEHALCFIRNHAHAHFLNEKSTNQFIQALSGLYDFFEEGKTKQIIRDLPANGLIAIFFGAFLELHRLIRAGHLEETPELMKGIEESCWDAVRIHD
ncbi:TetR/AcrR family transcriptional regulator [Metabacillus sp. KIGAM252]|uniref:TetR/AcrR family transcriptional regulator n=2 Tax=Metabacillus flavus TaxID=2823519 RepID=A0ABS5LG94_9BACI|nr:TetR/AcrR family transcriptional regulator [Metabacillus flavus]